jgi:PEGA domain
VSTAPIDPPPVAAAPLAVPAAVAVTIETMPTGAALLVDGKPVGHAPQTLDVADGRDLQIRAELAGRVPAVRIFHVTAAPSTVTIRLDRIARPARTRDNKPAPAQPSGPKPYDPDDVSGAD